MRYRNALLATSLLAIPLLALPGAAKAQPVQGLYVGAGLGLHIPQDPRISAGPVFGGTPTPIVGAIVVSRARGSARSNAGRKRTVSRAVVVWLMDASGS